MIALHVRTLAVVVVHELSYDVIQVPFAEKDELEKALVLDRLNESLDTSIGPYLRLRPIGMMRCDRFV